MHRLRKVNGIQDFQLVAVLQKRVPTFDHDTALGVSDYIRAVALKQVRLQPKPGFTTAGTAHNQHVFVSRILRVGRSVAHHQTFRFCQNDVVCKFRSLKRINVLGVAPPGRAVLHAVPVFLGVFASQIYGKP